jgi:hypothetical protein
MAARDRYTLSNHDSVPAPIRDSMIAILRHWDDNNSQNAYLQYFTPNATLRFAGDKVGRAAIQAARDGMIHPVNGPVVQCTHRLEKGWTPPGKDSESEIIVHGVVTYELKNGRKVECPVASMGRFVEAEEGKMQAEYYEVFIDTLELNAAIMEMLSTKQS